MWNFEIVKIGQNLHANMEGFRRASHMYSNTFIVIVTRMMNCRFWCNNPVLVYDLHNLELWADKWLMSFNVSKCEVLLMSLRNALEFSYVLCNFPLQTVN